VEQYRTEEEQVEALRRWWNENGRSTLAAVVLALGAGFGWQAWQANEVRQQEQASDLYQALLQAIGTEEVSTGGAGAIDLAEQLKSDFNGTTYAQFAALHLAALAVNEGKLPEAEAQLRWVLGRAAAGSDTARVAQLRLARVVASSGDTDQALTILTEVEPGSYGASYAAAQGDILLAAGRNDEARDAYNQALGLAGGGGQGVNLPVLQQKLQSLTPVPARTLGVSADSVSDPAEAEPAPNDTVDIPEE
jgi:predicted negative regulator of RcsB-dependent stress response